jgi:hypothetical protein
MAYGHERGDAGIPVQVDPDLNQGLRPR